jgi:hypothetical protein
VPIPVIPHGFLPQNDRNAAIPDLIETFPGGMRAIPSIRPTAPVHALVQEHLLGEPFDDLDARLHHHERRDQWKADIDMDIHLRLGQGRAQDKEKGEGKCGHSHGWILIERLTGSGSMNHGSCQLPYGCNQRR